MKAEVEAAANWWSEQLSVSVGNEKMLEKFKLSLTEFIMLQVQDHWYPEDPLKGSAHRSIDFSVRLDPLLKRAGDKVGVQGLDKLLVHTRFTTMFINPGQVRLHRPSFENDEFVYKK